MGATATTRTSPLPGAMRRPPVRAAISCAVIARSCSTPPTAPPFTRRAPFPLLRRLEALQSIGREVQRGVGGNDGIPRVVRVEDERVVPFGSQLLDDRVHPRLDRMYKTGTL